MGRTDLDVGDNDAAPIMTSRSGPAVARFNGDVYLAWVGHPNLLINVINLRTMNKVTLRETGIGGAALAVLGSRLFLAWTGTDPEHHLNLMSAADGAHFENKVKLTHTSFDRPALAALKGQLYLAWVGTEGEGHLNVLHSGDGYSNFSVNTKLVDTSFAGPSLTVEDQMQTLWLGWVGNDGEGHLNFISSGDGENFGPREPPLAETSGFAPGMSWYHDLADTPSQFYAAWTGQDAGHSLNHIHSLWAGTYEGKLTLGYGSIAGPALLASAGRIDIFWTDDDGLGQIRQSTIVGP
jgi:hypothetical protein